MRRMTTLAAGLVAASCLLLGCGDSDGDTGSSDADADTQVEGNRETVECGDTDADVASESDLEESGDDPQGSTETAEECTSGNQSGTGSGGDGEVESGGTPGVGTP
jgi:hypothetical protein